MLTRRPYQSNQQGFAAIVVALVLVLILSLITVGFASLMRREQNNALNRQLSSQAYYAAESGLNDARQALNSGFTLTKQTCGPYVAGDSRLTGLDPAMQAIATTNLGTNTVGSGTSASYPCLLIDPNPNFLQYTIDTSAPRATQITGALSTPPYTTMQIKSLIIGWEGSPPTTNFATNVSANRVFDTASNWNSTGMLKITLTPLTSSGIDRNRLINTTFTAFLYPNAADSAGAPNQVTWSSGLARSGGYIVNGNCHKDNRAQPGKSYCAVEITGMRAADFLLTIGTYYQSSNVIVVAKGGGGSFERIKNAQALIDVTGKSQDVLRRLQARLSLKNDYIPPAGTEAAGSICKQLQIYQSITNIGADSQANCSF